MPSFRLQLGHIIWTKGSACSLGWLKGSRFKGSEVDLAATLTNEINGKRKKGDAINPEPGTLNLLTQTDRMSNLRAISSSIKDLRSILLV
jgi:hypothetical protein